MASVRVVILSTHRPAFRGLRAHGCALTRATRLLAVAAIGAAAVAGVAAAPAATAVPRASSCRVLAGHGVT
ncbi:MAG: hypothetical protein ABSC73_05045, partial [Acidimicrobiales bacterium]